MKFVTSVNGNFSLHKILRLSISVIEMLIEDKQAIVLLISHNADIHLFAFIDANSRILVI